MDQHIAAARNLINEGYPNDAAEKLNESRAMTNNLREGQKRDIAELFRTINRMNNFPKLDTRIKEDAEKITIKEEEKKEIPTALPEIPDPQEKWGKSNNHLEHVVLQSCRRRRLIHPDLIGRHFTESEMDAITQKIQAALKVVCKDLNDSLSIYEAGAAMRKFVEAVNIPVISSQIGRILITHLKVMKHLNDDHTSVLFAILPAIDRDELSVSNRLAAEEE